jgi:hypothetical protein
MGMMPVYYSTTNTKKRKQKRKPGWQQREAEHAKWMKKMGIDPDEKPTKREFVEYKPKEAYVRETPNIPSCSNNIGGVAPMRESPKYTGTLIKGVATMHKSNAVPIISKEQATDISNMSN